MTLKDMKEKVLKLLEEYNSSSTNYTTDIDISNKLNVSINSKMFELARYKKIPAVEKIEVVENQEFNLYEDLDYFYQLDKIKGIKYEKDLMIITFLETGTAKIYYYKLPKRITADTDDSYKFELTEDVLEIMEYGVLSDILKNDSAAQFGKVWENAYENAKRMLDPRDSIGSISIKGGIDI